MSLSYEATNWENGKTVLKAEHLRKIEKGITDIISENNALYTDEDTRKFNEINRQNTFSNKISEVNDKITEINNSKENMTNAVSNKINEIETKFNELTISKQQDAEVIMARDGETSLKARLDRDIEKAKQVYVNVEGSNISTDSSVGYAKDVEILGNTIQDASNLADIRSVGDKVEGQELYEIPVVSCGKNLFDKNTCVDGYILSGSKGEIDVNASWFYSDFIKVKAGVTYRMGAYKQPFDPYYSCLYSKDKTFIKSNIGEVFTPSENGYVRLSGIIENKDKGQLEESAIVTPYEPFQSDKLTILSPVQIEKVGDVADRIIEKDGVWGVEKNIGQYILTRENYKPTSFRENDTMVCFGYGFTPTCVGTNSLQNAISSRLVCKNINQVYNLFEEGFAINNSKWLYIAIPKASIDNISLEGIYDWIFKQPFIVYYELEKSQFIPLPHSQQVKLRTFANKTNISFLTEIEGTIKAQVPKSIGATVNTHTEQINNLNKELDRVKKLEESTVSTVTTESDFTTVEATSNGYFEDVKLEGKTLVNLYATTSTSYDGTTINGINTLSNMTLGKLCTIICKAGKPFGVAIYKNNIYKETLSISQTTKLIQLANDEEIKVLEGKSTNGWDCTSNGESVFKKAFIILEGDHTQNPPSFFEGLKSVGQDVDKIEVLSRKEDGNLFDEKEFVKYINTCDSSAKQFTENNKRVIQFNNTLTHDKPFMRNNFKPNTKYTFSMECKNTTGSMVFLICLYTDGTTGIIGSTSSTTYTTIQGSSDASKTIEYIYISYGSGGGCAFVLDNFLVKQGTSTTYEPLKQDKKQILYYNENGELEPIQELRQWDSIEKHANGKYYYHQRSGEVVLNGGGNEYWTNAIITSNTNTIRFALNNMYTSATEKYMGAISDKFKIVYNDGDMGADSENIGINGYANALFLTIEKSKLSTQDLAGFKQWLQANNVTVVYQLAKEKVYECTNIDLITYANETNYVVESGAIVPKTTLKVHNNISNVVSLLQKKVSLLESNITSYMITQNRLMLASRYNADTVSFKVDVASFSDTFEYDNDLYELILNNILVGKDNYNRDYIENLIIFYWMDFVISDEMYITLFEIIEEQHNPKVIEEETPLI